MKPPDLSSGSVSLVVSGGDPEDDGGLGGGVNVGSGQAGVGDDALGAWSTEHSHKSKLGWRGGYCLGVSLCGGLCRFYCQVHAEKYLNHQKKEACKMKKET